MIPSHTIKINHKSRTDTFRLWTLGDLHIGNEDSREDVLKENVKEIESDPYSYWVDLGDNGEYIAINDRTHRLDGASLASWIRPQMLDDIAKYQTERLSNILHPIQSKCLGILGGNHEYEIQRASGFGIGAVLASNLGAKYLGDLDSWLDVVFLRGDEEDRKRQSGRRYTFMLNHGWGGGISEGALANKLHAVVARTECDAFITAHNHHQLAVSYTVTTKRGNKTVYRTRAGVMAGGYLPNPRYGRRKGYPPVSVGSAKLLLHPDDYGLEVVIGGYGYA